MEYTREEVAKWDKDDMFEYLCNVLFISDDFLYGAICVGGFNEKTMLRVLEHETGYHSFEQYIECELEGFAEEN